MTTLKADPRSNEQKQADELAAAGKWEEFETESLISEEAALEMIHRKQLAATQNGAGAVAASENIRLQPFRWRDKVFRILRCDYKDGHAQVEVAPADPEFAQELKKRVEGDRFHTLTYYQGFGFICFPEDYAKYHE